MNLFRRKAVVAGIGGHVVTTVTGVLCTP
jgi:hypothetical protein